MGSLLPAQVFSQAMLKTGGSVINLSSMSATQPLINLVSDEASFVNGVVIPVDGGFPAYTGV